MQRFLDLALVALTVVIAIFIPMSGEKVLAMAYCGIGLLGCAFSYVLNCKPKPPGQPRPPFSWKRLLMTIALLPFRVLVWALRLPGRILAAAGGEAHNM